MQTINWQESNLIFEDEDQSGSGKKPNGKGMEVEEKSDSEAAQLRKYQDLFQDKNRQAYENLLDKFGTLLANQNLHENTTDLLTEDFEVFIFSSTGRTPVQYATGSNGIVNLFKNIQIHERRVRETHIDIEKSTACQICCYSISYPDSNAAEEEFACEIFSIRDGRISKYRASFGRPVYSPEFVEDPLEPTRKDRMLSKVKEINYALAGQPDFERVASLLGENIEYKIWSWDDFKCFSLNKHDFAESFNNLQENMVITSVVPYELYSEPQGKFIASTYVYHLNERSSGQKFIWLSTCTYAFDGNLNLIKVNQQGELHPEGEVDIPFETFSRERFEDILGNFYTSFEANLEMMYSDKVLYDCIFWDFTIEVAPNPGPYKGLKHIDKLMESIEIFKDAKPEYVKLIDVYVDNNNRSHDVAFGILCTQGPNFLGGPDKINESFNCVGFVRMAFENGKVAKVLEFLSVIPTQIPTPFDDKSFQCVNIK